MDETGALAGGPQPAPPGPAQAAPPGGAPWRPLLSGELAGRAWRTVDTLMEGLGAARAVGPGRAAPSLSAGSAGLAVCHAMLARVHGEQRAAGQAAAQAAAWLGHAIESLALTPAPAALYSGFTGVAWAAEIVDGLLATGDGDRNVAIDRAVATLLHRDLPESVPYDLINGLTGLGVYALARWPRAAGADCLTAVTGQLARRARRDSDGVYWWTPPALLLGPQRQRYPDGGVDLGVAHGMAGVLPLLARAHVLGAGGGLAGPLLAEAVRWLLAHQVRDGSGQTVPGFLAAGTTPARARTAWCYGDPGVAMALLLAARDTGETAWAEAAISLALRAAAQPPELTGVTDAGLCHGAAGLAHLFNRMYQLTAQPELARAAVFWIERTLALCAAADQDPPPAGAARPAWNGPGLLEGAAGIALALLAASTAAEPVWDQMLLVAPAPAVGAEP
jgi:lantibiotic modifying enzyme